MVLLFLVMLLLINMLYVEGVLCNCVLVIWLMVSVGGLVLGMLFGGVFI